MTHVTEDIVQLLDTRLDPGDYQVTNAGPDIVACSIDPGFAWADGVQIASGDSAVLHVPAGNRLFAIMQAGDEADVSVLFAQAAQTYAHWHEDGAELQLTTDWSIYAQADDTYAGFGPDGVFYATGATDETDLLVSQPVGSDSPTFRVRANGEHVWSDGTADPGNGAFFARVQRGVAPSQQDGLAFADFFEGREVDADPDAPPANKGRLFFKDIGGKTALVARFPTGAIQQIAIQP